MKPVFTIVFAFFFLQLSAQNFYRLHERMLSYNQSGLAGMGNVTSQTADSLSGNSTAGQKNMVQHNGVFYHAYHSSVSGDADIYLRKSTNGVNWSNPVVVNNDLTNETQIWPSIVVIDSGLIQKVVVGWRDSRLGENKIQYRVAVSNNGGTSFKPSVQVSNHTDSPVNINGNIAVDAGGNFYAVWFRDLGGSVNNTWFSRSRDGGYTWTPMVVAYTGSQYSEPCEIVARGNGEALFVVSADQSNKKNLIAVTTADSGRTWTNNQFTSYSDFQELMQYHSVMVDDSGKVHIVWTYVKNGTGFKILYAKSNDFGRTWTAPVQVSDPGITLIQSWNYNNEQWPSIVKSKNNKLYVTWSDQRNGLVEKNADVFIATSSNSGQTWSRNVKVNDDTTILYQAQVSLAVKSTGLIDDLLVTWIDNRSENLVNAIALPKYQPLSLKYFPNPVSSELILSNLNFKEGNEISVTDMVGNIIHIYPITWEGTMIKIPTLALQNGIYFLKIKSGDKLGIARFVKAK